MVASHRLLALDDWERFEHSVQARYACTGHEDRFAGLWSSRDTDAVCRFVDLADSDAIRLFCRGLRIHPRLYRRRDGQVDHPALQHLAGAGASINLQRVENYSNRVLAFTRWLERRHDQAVQANLYVTPPHGRGLRPHSDTHDVLVVQVQGRKEWTVDGPVWRHDGSREPATATATSVTLTAGDWLYVPASVRHDVRNDANEPSVHLAIGFHTVAVNDDAEGSRFAQYQTHVPLGDVPDVAGTAPIEQARFVWVGEPGSVTRTASGLRVMRWYRRSPLDLRQEAQDTVERMIEAGEFNAEDVTTGDSDETRLLCRFLHGVGLLRCA